MKDELAHIENELLVMDAQDGNLQAMERLVDRWQKRLWRYAFRLTADREAAWDITQESWLGIIKGLRKLRDPANFKAWAYRIATNKSLDWMKARSAVKEVCIEDVPEQGQEKRTDTGVAELLEKLDATKRAILSLYYFEQLSIAEISVALGIPKGTAKSRLHNARKTLKELWRRHAEQ